MRTAVAWLILAGLFGCGSDSSPPRRSTVRQGIPAGVVVDDHAVPLKRTGMRSAEELASQAATIEGREARRTFSRGYRLAYTADRDLADFAAAASALDSVVAGGDGAAEALRVLAYAGYRLDEDIPAAVERLRQATELKPDFGEAYYDIAHFLALTAPERGSEAFERASALGVADERNLGPRFYRRQ